MDGSEQVKAAQLGRWLPWGVLAGCLCVTALASLGNHAYNRRAQEQRFEGRVRELHHSIQRRMGDYVQNLYAGHAWVDGRSSFSHAAWSRMVQTLRLDVNCPGAETMAFLRCFPRTELDTFLTEERAMGGDELRIRPGGIRDHYAVIIRIEPSLGAIRERLGADVLVSEVRREMVVRARDSGEVAISRGLQLINETGEGFPAFLIYKAVYRGGGIPATLEGRRQGLIGLVAMSARFHEVVASVLPPEPREVAVSLIAPVATGAAAQVYSEMPPGSGSAGLERELPLSLGGQVWRLRYQARPSFIHPLERWGPLANLFGGLLGSGLLFALTRSLLSRRQQAEAIAQSMTASLSSALNDFQNLLDAATQVGIVMTDAQGLVRVFNRGAERILGWTSDEIVGRESPLLWHDPEELDGWRRTLGATGLVLEKPFDVFAHLTKYNQEERIRWRWITKRGERRLVDMIITRVKDPVSQSLGYLGVSVDVTERVAAEEALRLQDEQLRQSQKMDAIGQLAGGVAHDFNNMLAGILGSAELLAEGIPGDDPHHALVRTIVKASERAAELTSKLLAFSRKGKLVSTALDLHRIVQDTLALLGRSVDKRIEIRQELKARSPLVVGDPSQLENALLNLCINARDAMPEGGLLTVATEDVQLREALTDPAGFHIEAGSYVRLSVRDTGHGIPAEIRDHIFEPFFTTKAEGRGTGLGLAAVYGIVKSHQGALQVESEPGRGSVFSILLPLDETARPQAPEEPREQHRGEGTILVIDDEEMIRSVSAHTLGAMGYRVLQAADGAEGVRLFEAHRHEIRLVLLDLVMPGISGRETFQRLHRLDPQVRVIAVSGFANDQSVADMLAEGLCGFLHKPYGMRALGEAIREALG